MFVHTQTTDAVGAVIKKDDATYTIIGTANDANTSKKYLICRKSHNKEDKLFLINHDDNWKKSVEKLEYYNLTQELPTLPTIFYKHYNGSSYRVVGMAINTNDDMLYVLYRQPNCFTHDAWARPYSIKGVSSWADTVQINDKDVPRFLPIENEGAYERVTR